MRRYSPRRVSPGDAYDDLAEAVERGAIKGDGRLGRVDLRERYTVALGSWEAMIGELLGQLAADAGSVERALVLLGIPGSGLISAWMRGAEIGARDSARWMAQALARGSDRVVLTASVRALWGDAYLDLAAAAGSLAAAGDGALDPARLRRRYTLERAPWLRMVADLLSQVVGDAGSVEHASTVLAVPLASLTTWVRWLVSRGSVEAACSRWPVAPVGDDPGSDAYLDLVEAVECGAVVGDNAIDQPRVRDMYSVRLDSWARMEADLLGQIITDAGSIREAAKLLDVPRSTLGSWARRRRERALGGPP